VKSRHSYLAKQVSQDNISSVLFWLPD